MAFVEVRSALRRGCGSVLLLAASAAAWPDVCVEENGRCGAFGVQLWGCCNGLSCGGAFADMRCGQEPAPCVSANALCGFAGRTRAACCEGLTCASMPGLRAMRCAATPPTDEAEGEEEEGDANATAALDDTEASDEVSAGGEALDQQESDSESLLGSAPEQADGGEGEDGNATSSDADEEADYDDTTTPQTCAVRMQACGAAKPCCTDLTCTAAEFFGQVCLGTCREEESECGMNDVEGDQETYQHPEERCCGDLQCTAGSDGRKRCQRPAARCSWEGAICGSDASVSECCEGYTCRPALGGSRMRCRKALPACLVGGTSCGYDGLLAPVDCCEGYTCAASEGKSEMTCAAS